MLCSLAQGSIKTEQINQLDLLRDKTWSALTGKVRVALLSPVAEEVESAKVLKRVFDLYGNVRKMSFNEETAALSNLI